VPGYDSLGRRHGRVQARRHSWYRGAVVESACLDADYYPLSLAAQLRESVEWAALPLYLRVEDRNLVAHSVELRLPFLDYRLVSLSFSLSARWKLNGPWNKHLLREAMRNRIPEIVRARPDKMGFPTPSDAWFRGPWYEPMRTLIVDS